jgi:predicted ABC-type ATPase
VIEAILIAGPNGAGKTTMARQLLPLEHPDAVFLNADEIQREERVLGSPVGAGRELLLRLDRVVAARKSFALETTLSSEAHARRVPTWKAEGYRFVLHFIELPSAELAVARVARRVAAGGHDVPEADVRRRFARGRRLFESHYKPLANEWYHWLSDDEAIILRGSGPG